MNRNIEFEVLGIAGVLHRYRLHVPPNQREFAWTEEEVRELLQDLANAMRKGGDAYFLGTIVLTKCSEDKLEVADGQQRLATATMILATIRDRFSLVNDDLGVRSIENDFLFTIDLKARETAPKLILNLDDNAYFQNAVLARPGERKEIRPSRRSHRLISQAAQVIRDYFADLEKQLGAANFQSALVDWKEYLNVKTSVVTLRVSNAGNAFIMFETLNDRGLKTSQADLVKNYLFGEAGDRLVEAQAHWSAMRGAIETVGEEDRTMEYLRLACCVMHGATRERDVMDRVEANARGKNEAIRLLGFFSELSNDYAAILNPDHPKWNQYDESVGKAIATINRLGVTQIRPLMLSLARHFNHAQIASAFRRMVAWSVRFLIVGGRGGKLDEGYAKLANDVYKNVIRSDADLVRAAEGFVPTDAQFSTGFENARVSVSRLARYYLRALETTARNEQNPEFVPNEDLVINLEHIMPTTLTVEWSSVSQQDVETHAQRLGNLALLQATKNSQVGNGSFESKREIYRQSTFLLTAQIADLSSWGKIEIENRQKTLAGFAVKTWPLN